LIRKTQRQDAISVITPPSRQRGPQAERLRPFPTRREEVGHERERSRRGDRGTDPLQDTSADQCALRRRQAVENDAAPNSAVPTRNMRRRPNKSAARPPSSTSPPNIRM